MALTKTQKDFLNEVARNEESLDKIINNEINFNSYIEEYTIDGNNLLIVLMKNYDLMSDSELNSKIQKAIIKLLENGFLLTQQKGRKLSAYNILIDKLDIYFQPEEFHRKYFSNQTKTDEVIKFKNNLSSIILPKIYQIISKNKELCFEDIRLMTVFYKNKYLDNFTDLFEKKKIYKKEKEWHYFSKDLINEFVNGDDLLYFVKYCDDYLNKESNSLKSAYFNFDNVQQKGNILAICAQKNASNIFCYLANQNMFNLDGSISDIYSNINFKNNLTRYKNPLYYALKNDNVIILKSILDHYEKNQQNISGIVESLFVEKENLKHKTFSNDFFIDFIITNKDIISPIAAKDILNYCIQFGSLCYVNKIIDNIGDKVPLEKFEHNIKNLFLKRIFNTKNESENEIKIQIYNKLSSLGFQDPVENEFVNFNLFENLNLLIGMKNAGFSLFRKELTNDFRNHPIIKYATLMKVVQNNDVIKNTFKTIKWLYKEYENDIIGIFEKTSLLNQLIKENAPIELFECLSDKQIIKMKEKYGDENCLLNYYNLTDENKIKKITKRLMDLNFNFSNNEKAILTILDLIKDVNFISVFLDKYNISITELSKNKFFWAYINDDILDLIKERNPICNNIETSLYIYGKLNEDVIKKYLYCGGNTNIGSEPLLQNLIQNKSWSSVLFFIKEMPELMNEVNSQNKYPIQYLLPKINKIIEDKFKLNEEAKKVIEIFEINLKHGLANLNNDKSFLTFKKTLEEKYPDILNYKPEYKSLLMMADMERKMSKIEIKSEDAVRKNKI